MLGTEIYTSPGQTLIITPILYDPHQTFDDLISNTRFPELLYFNWLSWNQGAQSLLGIVRESLLTGVYTKAIAQVQGLFTVDLPIEGRTIKGFSRGLQYETKMMAKVKVSISQTHLERSLLTQKAILEASSATKPTQEVIDSDTSPSNVQFGKEVDLEPGPQPCSKHDGLHIAPVVLGGHELTDEPSPCDSSGLVVFWGQRFKE